MQRKVRELKDSRLEEGNVKRRNDSDFKFSFGAVSSFFMNKNASKHQKGVMKDFSRFQICSNTKGSCKG